MRLQLAAALEREQIIIYLRQAKASKQAPRSRLDSASPKLVQESNNTTPDTLRNSVCSFTINTIANIAYQYWALAESKVVLNSSKFIKKYESDLYKITQDIETINKQYPTDFQGERLLPIYPYVSKQITNRDGRLYIP